MLVIRLLIGGWIVLYLVAGAIACRLHWRQEPFYSNSDSALCTTNPRWAPKRKSEDFIHLIQHRTN